MKISNPFLLNDWNIRPFLIIIGSLYFAFLGSIGLDVLGHSIPLLRQIFGFLFLTFAPGFLVLRTLQVHHLDAVRTTIYAAGLSLALLMFTGFFMNIAYSLFGVTRPLSLWPLIATISALVGALCILTWSREREFIALPSLKLHETLSPPVLALSLLPFGAIAGTYLLNYYNINTLQMILLPVIAIVPMVIMCTRFITERYYPYAVISIAITLLYHTSLISTYIWGWDIQYEYYFANLVAQNGFWDPTVYSNVNAMLSTVMLAPIYSITLNLGLDWVFKIIYPLLFSLVPLGLYAIFRQQVPGRVAFLGCFFFVSLFAFYDDMLQLPRQEIAEFFTALIILSLINRDLTRLQRTVFFLVFSMSLIVSHYGLSYLFIFILFMAWVLATTDHYVDVQKYAGQIISEIQRKLPFLSGLRLKKWTFYPAMIPSKFVLFYGLFILVWYMYMSSSSAIDAIVRIAHHTATSISSELLNSDATQGLAIIVTETATPLHEVAKYLQVLTIFFITIGFGLSFVHHKEVKFDIRYLVMAFGALCICVGGVVLPYFASALNTSRLYQICLIFLAPFCVVGGLAVFSVFKGFPYRSKRPLQLFSIFIGLFLLFNCGWIYEFAHDDSTSFALNSDLDRPIFSEPEILAAKWTVSTNPEGKFYADGMRWLLFLRLVGRDAQTLSDQHIPTNSNLRNNYLMIGKYNIESNSIAIHKHEGTILAREYVNYHPIVQDMDKIYCNSYSNIYCR